MDPKTGEVGNYDPHSRPALRNNNTAPEKEEKAEKPENPRNAAIEEIAKRREAERQLDMNSFRPLIMDDDGNVTEPEAPKAEVEGETAPLDTATTDAEPALETAADEQAEPAEPEEERELVVNGKTIKVPLSKIIEAGQKTLQKETAADEKLANAAELERRYTELVRTAQPPNAGAQPTHEAPKANAQPSDEDAEFARAIQFGSEDEAKSAIAKLRTSGRGVSQQELQSFVSQNIAPQIRAQISFDDANNWVRGEYAHIFTNPDMEQLFMLKETQAREKGNRDPHRTLYKSIAQELETNFHLKKAEATATAKTATQDRIVKKMAAPSVVRGASGKTASKDTAPRRPPTVAEYVEQQRAARGQGSTRTPNQGI